MSVDRQQALALALPPTSVTVERGSLRFFASAIGETRPEYVDVGAARAAGHRDLPAPPTYLFSLELQGPDPLGFLADLGVDLRGVLHGEQWFDYRRPVCAGDTLTLQPRLVDVVTKKGGAMQLLHRETTVSNHSTGEPVALLGSVLVLRSLT